MSNQDTIQQWLQELKAKGNLSDENFRALNDAITAQPQAQEFVKGSILRQQDYSRRMNDLQQQEAATQTYQQSLVEWKTKAESEYNSMRQKLAEAEAARARAAALAQTYGADPEEIGTYTPPAQPRVETPTFDPKDFISTKDAQEAMVNQLRLQNKLLTLSAQHQKLFGEPLMDDELVDRALRNRRSIEDEWKESFQVEQKRNEQAQAQQEALLARIREEERAKVLSELQLPQSRPEAPTSPLYATNMIKTAPTQGETDTRSGVQAAIDAWNERRYAQK